MRWISYKNSLNFLKPSLSLKKSLILLFLFRLIAQEKQTNKNWAS